MAMTEVLPQISDPELEQEDPVFTHIIGPANNMTGAAQIMEAMVNGTPVVALCGYTWVPFRDPQKYPVCPKCKEIVEFAKDMRL